MKKLAKSLGALLVAFSLIGCGNHDVPASDKTPTVENFNSDKYDLKIKSKYQNVGGKLDLSGGKKQHIRAARKLAVNNGVAETSGNSMVLSIDDEGIQTLMQLDPDLDVNSTGQAARILTAPEKSTLVEVVGTQKESTPANNAEGGESSDNSVVAPSKFQMVEYDANGTYGIDIGENFQKLELSVHANGVIQPRSIKTKDFTFSDSTMNFATARSDVYFIKDGDYDGMSAERPYELNISTYRLADYEMKVKPELSSAINDVLFGGSNKELSQGNVPMKFFTEFSNPDNLKEGIHKIAVNVRSRNDKFKYSTDIYIKLVYSDEGYPVLCSKPGVTMAFDAQTPEFVANYGYCFVNSNDVITRDYTKEENLKRLKDNFDIYMSTDLDKTTNLIDSASIYTCAEAPEIIRQSDDWCTFILEIGNFFYYIY